MKTYHVDGGAFVEPPEYKFHDAFFTVIDGDGKIVYHNPKIGDIWSGLAEFEAIRWVVENIKDRPIRITSDCKTAISWARKGSSKKSKFKVRSLSLSGIELEYQHGNLADVWNAESHSPKYSKEYYVARWRKAQKDSGRSSSASQGKFL